MSKQTFKKAQAASAKKLYQFETVLKRTKAFQQFRQEKFERTTNDDDQVVLYHFYQSPQYARIGPELQGRMNFFPERAVYDAPYTKYAYLPNFEEGQWMEFRINLQCSKDQILRELDYLLDHYRNLKTQKTRGDGILNPQKTDELIRAYDLVEKHGGSVLCATWEMYPNTKNLQPYEDDSASKHWNNVRDWHNKISGLIKDL